MRLTVIGCGRLGAAHAACMAEIGHEVLGVDIDDDRIRLLSSGRAPFYEPALDEMLARNVANRRLNFTTNFAAAAAFAPLHFITVGTPASPDDDGYDLSAYFAAGRAIAAQQAGQALIVGRSTVPPGTAARLARDLGPRSQLAIAANPDFCRGGYTLRDMLDPDRIVVGVPNAGAANVLREVYRPLTDGGTPLLVTDPATAELTKAAANAFLAVKTSFVNAMADLGAGVGADIALLAEAVGLDHRIGRAGLTAGIGYGGGCLPKDVRGLARFAANGGAEGQAAARLLGTVDEINMVRRQRIVDLVVSVAGPLRGRRVAVWGASFKPGSDDIRDSPGLDVADRLYRLGAEVLVYDPLATPNALIAFPHLGFADSALAAAHEADAVLAATAWPEFAAINPAAAAAAVSAPLLVDACQGTNPALWRAAGWTVAALYPLPRYPERAGATPPITVTE